MWARLTSSFPTEALAWIVAELEPGGGLARLEPAWAPAAVRQRLDAELGVPGWSYALSAFGAGGVVCALTVAGVTRSSVAASGDSLVPLEQLADLAFSRCARQFGMAPPVAAQHPSYWVEVDTETLEPLFEPEPVPEPVPETAVAAPAAAASAASAAPDASPGRAVSEPPREASSEALAMIEKLIDRLKAEGKGKEAARLVATHHGDTAEQARELYSRLRALLKQEAGA